MTPVLFTLMFTYMYGGAISGSTSEYLTFILPVGFLQGAAFTGAATGVNLARKHIGWYTKGLPGSAEFRNRVNMQDDPAVVVEMLREFYAPWLSRAAA